MLLKMASRVACAAVLSVICSYGSCSLCSSYTLILLYSYATSKKNQRRVIQSVLSCLSIFRVKNLHDRAVYDAELTRDWASTTLAAASHMLRPLQANALQAYMYDIPHIDIPSCIRDWCSEGTAGPLQTVPSRVSTAAANL